MIYRTRVEHANHYITDIVDSMLAVTAYYIGLGRYDVLSLKNVGANLV